MRPRLVFYGVAFPKRLDRPERDDLAMADLREALARENALAGKQFKGQLGD